MMDEVLMAEVRDQLMDVHGDEELVHEIVSDLKSEGMFDIPLDEDIAYPDDELGTMPLW